MWSFSFPKFLKRHEKWSFVTVRLPTVSKQTLRWNPTSAYTSLPHLGKGESPSFSGVMRCWGESIMSHLQGETQDSVSSIKGRGTVSVYGGMVAWGEGANIYWLSSMCQVCAIPFNHDHCLVSNCYTRSHCWAGKILNSKRLTLKRGRINLFSACDNDRQLHLVFHAFSLVALPSKTLRLKCSMSVMSHVVIMSHMWLLST